MKFTRNQNYKNISIHTFKATAKGKSPSQSINHGSQPYCKNILKNFSCILDLSDTSLFFNAGVEISNLAR